ncbi:hypothetical protein [Halanaerobaculum tunisiense]
MKKYITFVMIILLSLSPISWAQADDKLAKTGQIVAVNAQQNTILLQANDEVKEYKVALDATIKVNQQQASLTALRPIQDNYFQQAKIKLNQQGKITTINSFYQTVPIVVREVHDNVIIVENLNTKQTAVYNLDSDLQIRRNNYQASSSDLKPGDQGRAILGINRQLSILVVHHYQATGLITEIDREEKKVTVNLGSDLNPREKTFKIREETKLLAEDKEVGLSNINVDQWIKLEVDNQVQSAVVRDI